MMAHHFFANLSRMKYIRRWGLMRNTLPENDMEHAMQAAMIAHALAVIGNARHGRRYDAEHIMALALYHDATEVITGDLPTPVKHFNPSIKTEYAKIEALAARRLMQMLPDDLKPHYRPLIEPDTGSDAWRIVKAADRICAYIKCVEEAKAGNSEFLEAQADIERSIRAIDLPEVADFMREFMPGFAMSLDQISKTI
ncbi:MAG: 5'-deoxynucleotidase [Clostridiales bacterium]|nr:5'-deoxynucleotidase [Clostridiales bacterium]